MNKILIIEDDLEINALLADFLKEKGYAVHCQYDGLHVLDFLNKEKIDLIILDIMLPYRSGDIILSDVRKKFTIPVIIISAKETTQNKIDLLRLGADDYITKPFDMEEVLARIESNLRRVQFQNSQTECLQYNNLTLDLEKNTAFLNGIELSLTAKEFGILELLMKYPDKVFSKSNLFQSVWDTEYIAEDNTLNVHISNLRNKLKAICSDTEFIDTVYLPTSPFKGQMSCVRELKLVQKEKKYILKQLPVKEMECLRTNKHEMKNIKMGADEEWTLCDKKEVLELDISYPIEKIHAQTFGIKISTGKNRQFEIVFCKEKQCCFVDRTTAGVNPHDKFAGKYKAPVDFTQEFLTIKLLMDVSQSELFINNGEVVMSNLLFPEDFYKVKLFATGGDLVIEKSIIYEMDEIMKHPLDEA